jgi:hypothetical protein
VIRHEVPSEFDGLLSHDRADHLVCATLLFAMAHGRDLHIEGTVSPMLLGGISQLQLIWNKWRPLKYEMVSVTADRTEEPLLRRPDPPALFTFSGGVDSTYSMLKHASAETKTGNLKPAAGLLVHGADIPLEDESGFKTAFDKAQRILDGIRLPVIPLKTNSRELENDWEDSHGLELSACLLILQAGFSHGVLSSWGSAEEIVYPWGSTPITDPLTSTEAMTIVHDGLERNRIEKVRWLSRHTEAFGYLRVCWEGPDKGSNCGRCEKCVRTLLNCWALGIPSPEAIPSELTPELIKSIRPTEGDHLGEWTTLLRTAKALHAGSDPNLRALQSVVRAESRRRAVTRLRQKVGGLVRRRFGGS